MFNWLSKLAHRMSVQQALSIFGLPSVPDKDTLQKRYRQLAMRHHTDLNKGEDQSKMVQINLAKEVLDSASSGGREYDDIYEEARHSRRQRWEVPEWQTDPRSNDNEVGPNRNFRSRCMHDIWENSKRFGPVRPITFWAFDGRYGRGVFTAMSNEPGLGFAGEVMEQWNNNAHKTVAVLANESSNAPSERPIRLIRIQGQDVSGQNIILMHNSFNNNPFNDEEFVEKLRNYIKGVDIYA